MFSPGESYGQKSLEGYSPRGSQESDTTQRLNHHQLSCHSRIPPRLGGHTQSRLPQHSGTSNHSLGSHPQPGVQHEGDTVIVAASWAWLGTARGEDGDPLMLTRRGQWPVQHVGHPRQGLIFVHTRGRAARGGLMPAQHAKTKGEPLSGPHTPPTAPSPTGTLTSHWTFPRRRPGRLPGPDSPRPAAGHPSATRATAPRRKREPEAETNRRNAAETVNWKTHMKGRLWSVPGHPAWGRREPP